MALPKINEELLNYVSVKVPSGKTIGVRGWKVRDEKELLFTLESDEKAEENKLKHIIGFLKSCVDDKGKFDTLTENDLKKICIEIRKLSKGDTIQYNYACDKCGHKFFDEVNLTESQEIKAFDNSPVIVNNALIMTFKDADWKTTEKLFNEFGEQPSKFAFKFVINSIESLTYNGATHTEFTAEEAETFIDDLTSDDLAKIYEEFDKKASSVQLIRSVPCMKCKAEVVVNFGELLSFLVL
jgi:DNA-directed RNA polymerase subunit RPC12/RpoP